MENLRQYKADTEHKKVYAWFDNSEKNPSSYAQHITSLPDSIDIVGLMYPSELAAFEKEEIILLFDYQNRDPLTNQATVFSIIID